MESRLSPSTLKVYVAAIAAHHDAVDGRSLGKHDLIVGFLKGARRMNPSRSPLVPSWDLSIVLAGLQRGPFEPLDSVELKFLSCTALLTVLTSIKRVGDLQAFSVSEECLVFRPVNSHVVLRPRPGYVPKIPITPFRDQVVNLQALCWVSNGREELAGFNACCPIPPHPGIRAPFFSPSSVPQTVNPGGILQAPPAVRLGGAV